MNEASMTAAVDLDRSDALTITFQHDPRRLSDLSDRHEPGGKARSLRSINATGSPTSRLISNSRTAYSSSWRRRSNPFYDYMEDAILRWLAMPAEAR
ncbi:hypothetical protein ACKVEX_12885 [Rhodocyclaceae bacterium SMB388]